MSKTTTKRPTLDVVNGAVGLVIHGGTLGRTGKGQHLYLFRSAARINCRMRSDRLWLRDRQYREMSCGGTCEQMLCQLILWYRGLPRRPLACWEYWCSPAVAADSRILAYLREHGYDDGESCRCVLCGSSERPTDWWCLDGVVGPCCRFGVCRNRGSNEPLPS